MEISDDVIAFMHLILLRTSVMEGLASKLVSVAPMGPPTGIVYYLNTLKQENIMATTREEALALIDAANAAMADAARKAEAARKGSTEAGLLTANDIIAEAVSEVSGQVFSDLPSVSSYVGTTCTQADVDRLGELEEQVVATANLIGKTLAILTKVAAKAYMGV